MPERGQLTRPMMRGCARFHADQTRLERPKIGDHAAAPQPPANDDVSIAVDAVDLEPVFGEIQTDGGNLHGGCGAHRRPRCGTSMPGAGAVHPIKTYGNFDTDSPPCKNMIKERGERCPTKP